MTILRRGNSKFWYVQFQVQGRTVIRSSRSTSRKAAELLEAELRSQAHAELYQGQKRTITLEVAITNLIQTKIGTANYENLVSQKRTVLQILRPSKSIEQIGLADLEEFCRVRSSAGVTNQTILHGLNLIRASLKLAKRQGYRVPDISFPTIRIGKGRLRYLSAAEERKLLDELNPARECRGLKPFATRSKEVQRTVQDCYDLVILLLDTGARYGEIANVEWHQVDVDQRVIRLWRSKVQNESVLFMTDRVHEILSRRRQAASGQYVFTNRCGGPRGYRAGAIRKAFRRAGLSDCTIHTLRHTHATRLIQNGLSLYEVCSVLGHSDIKTTMRYAHLAHADVTAKARDVINRLNTSMTGVDSCS